MVFSFYLQELLVNENTWDKEKLLAKYNKEEYKGNYLGTKKQPCEPTKDWIEKVLHDGTKLFRAQHLMYHINYVKTQYIKNRLWDYQSMRVNNAKNEKNDKYKNMTDAQLESICYASYEKWRRSMITKWMTGLLEHHKGFIVINDELAHKITNWDKVRDELEQNEDRAKTLKMCSEITEKQKKSLLLEKQMTKIQEQIQTNAQTLVSTTEQYEESRKKINIDIDHMTEWEVSDTESEDEEEEEEEEDEEEEEEEIETPTILPPPPTNEAATIESLTVEELNAHTSKKRKTTHPLVSKTPSIMSKIKTTMNISKGSKQKK